VTETATVTVTVAVKESGKSRQGKGMQAETGRETLGAWHVYQLGRKVLTLQRPLIISKMPTHGTDMSSLSVLVLYMIFWAKFSNMEMQLLFLLLVGCVMADNFSRFSCGCAPDKATSAQLQLQHQLHLQL